MNFPKSLSRIVAVHLYNDYSGSPRILAQYLQHAASQGHQVDLHTSKTGGILDSVEAARRFDFAYRPHANRIFTLLHFLWIQLLLFFRMLRLYRSGSVVYVNTLLPFGALLGARLAGLPILCHVHEVSVRPRLLNGFLRWVARRCADQLVFVSDFLKEQADMPHPTVKVIPNTLSPEFIAGIPAEMEAVPPRDFRVLMLASAKVYKGLHQFVELAERLPEKDFELVMNASPAEIDSFFKDTELPDNLTIWPTQKNVHPFYARAAVVLNLSLPDQWVETFGMTALEAMAHDRPVIVPNAGGIAEVVEDGQSGFLIDPYDLDDVAEKIKWLGFNRTEYRRMAQAARKRAKGYRFGNFAACMDACVEELAQGFCPTAGQAHQNGMHLDS